MEGYGGSYGGMSEHTGCAGVRLRCTESASDQATLMPGPPRSVLQQPGNRSCADCGASEPRRSGKVMPPLPATTARCL